MKIYLDIDETILDNGMHSSKPANYLKEFLEHILANHEVYWLSTHCDGDATVPVYYLSRFFDDDLISLVIRIKPTSWNMSKIEAINLDEDFLWFDDTLMDSEEKLLVAKGKLDSYVRVDLTTDPDIFRRYLDI